MRICLINVSSDNQNIDEIMPTYNFYGMYNPENIYIGYIASVLIEHGHTVFVLENEYENLSEKQVINKISEMNVSLIGIYIDYDNYMHGLIIAKRIMNTMKDTKVVLCGDYPSNLYRKLLMESYAHYCIIGEPEYVFLQLADELSVNKDTDIGGIAYCKDKEVYFYKNYKAYDISAYPIPYRQLTSILQTAKVLTARGCYNKCTFCTRSLYYRCNPGESYRRRSPKDVVDEIIFLKKAYNVEWIIFDDQTFRISGAVNDEWFNKFYNLVQNHKIHLQYFCRLRANEVLNNKENLCKFKQIGLTNVEIGAECFSDKSLRLFKKNITGSQNIEALRKSMELGLNCHINLVMFNVNTTLEEIKEGINILKDLINEYPLNAVVRPVSIDNIMYSIQGTEYYEYIKNNNFTQLNAWGYSFADINTSRCYALLQRWNQRIKKIYSYKYLIYKNKKINQFLKELFNFLFIVDSNAVYMICECIESKFGTDNAILELVENCFDNDLQQIEHNISFLLKSESDFKNNYNLNNKTDNLSYK